MGRTQTITVCHLISGDLWAGPEVQVHALLKSLQSVPELEISIIVLNEGKFAKLLAEAGFRVKVIDESKNRFPNIVKLAAAELTGRRIDILHSHRYKENFIATLLKKRCDVRHLAQTVHGIGEPFSGLKKLKVMLYDFLNDRATRQFDRVLAVSDDIRRELGNRYDISKIVTIHNAVDISEVIPKRSSEEVREELGIGPDHQVIGTIGRMVPIKGIDQFLSVAKIIVGKKPDVILLLAGDGPQQSEYENMARSMGLANNVRFLGYRHDAADILNCLDLFVMTSYHEGIPVVLLEAMTLKRPVVAMSVGGIPEVIEDNISGNLVEPKNVPRFAEDCLALLADPQRAQRYGEAARDRIKAEFSIDVQRDRVLNLYHDLMRLP